MHALAIVPLVGGEETKGALIVLDTAPRQWQADELQVLSMLAGQAAIALEKLQLLQAARGRALYLATLNDIGQAVTSSLDLDQMLLALLDKVREATAAEACSIALLDQESGDLVFRQAVGGAADAVIGLRLSPGEGLAGWVAQHRQSVLVPDAAADARVHSLEGSSGFVTHDLIGVPLIARDQVTGVIELVNKRRGQFDEDDRRLLESVAAQAAIAIENARLFETEHAGREQLGILYRAGQAINSTLDADTILDRLTDEAMRATHATHGSALVAHSEWGSFERRSLRGYLPEQVEQARADRLPLDRGINGRAYHSRQAVYVADVQIDPNYHPLDPRDPYGVSRAHPPGRTGDRQPGLAKPPGGCVSRRKPGFLASAHRSSRDCVGKCAALRRDAPPCDRDVDRVAKWRWWARPAGPLTRPSPARRTR